MKTAKKPKNFASLACLAGNAGFGLIRFCAISETAIDATLGLGEALVSGQVEPDHYVVDTFDHRILAKTLGAKQAA